MNVEDVKLSEKDEIEVARLMKLYIKQRKRLHIYKGKNKTKKRRYEQKLFKSAFVRGKIGNIISPYVDKIMVKAMKHTFDNFADVKDINFGESCTFDISKINDFGISKKMLEAGEN